MRNRLIQAGLLPLVLLLMGWGWPAAVQVLSRAGLSHDSLVRGYDTRTIYGYGNKYVLGGKQLPFCPLKTELAPGATSNLYQQASPAGGRAACRAWGCGGAGGQRGAPQK